MGKIPIAYLELAIVYRALVHERRRLALERKLAELGLILNCVMPGWELLVLVLVLVLVSDGITLGEKTECWYPEFDVL